LICSGTAILPEGIEISGMSFINTSADVAQPVLNIDSASNIRIVNTHFGSNVSATVYPNVVHIYSTVSPVSSLTFDGCRFVGGGNGIVNFGTTTRALSVMNSRYDALSNIAVIMNSMDSMSSINNYYAGQSGVSTKDSAVSFVSFGEVFQTGSDAGLGMFLGNLLTGVARGTSVAGTTYVAGLIPNTAGEIRYELSNSSARRFGTFTFATDSTYINFTDNYTESNISLGANLFANSDSLICSLNSGTGTLKYSITRFV
jgi:hypothetical protein